MNDLQHVPESGGRDNREPLPDDALYPPEDSLLTIDPKRILASIRRNIWWIAGIIAACVLLGAVITILTEPRYVATAAVLIEQESDEIIEGSDLAATTSYQDAERFLQTQLDVIGSRALAVRVMESENLAENPAFFEALGTEIPSEEDRLGQYTNEGGLAALRRDTAVDLLRENLSSVLPPDSRLAEIRFESGSPTLSARIANSFAENLIESNLGRKFESSSYARQFLAEQLAEARERLEESERELNQYSRAAGLIRVAGDNTGGANSERTLSVTNDSLVQVNLAASEATAARVSAQQQWQNIANVSPLSVPQVLSNPAIQNLIQQRSEAQALLAEEQSRHLSGHPSIKALEQQIAELNSQIASVGNSIKRSIYVEYQAAQDREESLQDRVGSLRSSALEEQDRGVQFNVLQRVAETNRTLYDTLLERYNELNATAGATSNNISLVDEAEVPREPTSPSLPVNLALSLLLGLGLAGGFVFVREQFDDTIRTPDDIEEKLGLPLMGIVPVSEAEEFSGFRVDTKTPVGEAYSSAVANLRWSSANGLPGSIVLTSAQPAEGKTTSSRAIAAELARLEKRVLLIDADLRRPTLHREVAKTDQPGLTAILAGEATLEEVAQPSDVKNLSLVTALPIPPDPTALLGSPRLAELIEHAKSLYDVVIIDSAPMLGLSDTPNLAYVADAVVVVVEASRGHKGAVKSSLRRLRMVRANVVGALLTKFDAKTAGYGYSQYGYSYYRYGKED